MIYFGIDSGTQSTKTIALDVETGAILASSQQPYGLIEGLPAGHMEQHPQIWIDAVEQTISDCLIQLGPRKNQVRGIGVSGQQHGLVVLDENDEVICPAKLWCDTSTLAECEAFNTEFGGIASLVELAGNAVLPGYTAPKLLWLKHHMQQHFARVRSILLPHDFINFWLTGEKRMEYGDASGTGLLDVYRRQWCQPLCDFIESGLAERLPPLKSSLHAVGPLREELRRQWGLAQSPLVSAGGGDNMMGAIGTGNTQAGVFTVSLGTSGTVYAYSSSPVVDAKGEIAAFCDSTDAWLPLVCTMNVTVATEQTRKMFGWSIKELNQVAASAPVGSGGLLFLPYLTGERTPNLPQGVGVFHGLTTANMTPPHLARATMEGATLGLAYGMERFRELGLTATEVRLTGGGSKSPLWRQMAADAFGVQTVCLETAEGAALGAAIQAASSDPNNQPLSEMTARLVIPIETTRALPNPNAESLYQEKMILFKNLTHHLHMGGHL